MTTQEIIDRLTPTAAVPLLERHAERLRPLAEVLPERFHVPTRCEPDAYGASWEIARSLGLTKPPLSSASWIHNVPVKLACPEQFTYQGFPTDLHLVGTTQQVEFLASHGCHNAIAVGMSYLYAPDPEIPRIPRSLLFAPGSTHLTDLKSKKWKDYQERYLGTICEFRGDFDLIVASMKAHTQAGQGNWYDMLEKFDIPWIIGGDLHDMNSLRRVKGMFSSFDVVLFNAWTSGCVYAAMSGARVCVFGPEPPRHEADEFIERQAGKRLRYMGQATDAREGVLIKSVYGMDQYAHIKAQYPWFFVEPPKAIQNVSWAANGLGLVHKRRPEEIARLLGWHYCPGDQTGELSGGEAHMLAQTLGWIPNTMGGTTALLEAHRALHAADLTLTQALAERTELKDRAHAAEQKYQATITDLKKKNRQLEKQLVKVEALQKSLTWRLLGKPLASLERRLKRLFGQ